MIDFRQSRLRIILHIPLDAKKGSEDHQLVIVKAPRMAFLLVLLNSYIPCP